MKRTIVAVLAAFLCVWPAFSQRTVNTQFFIEVGANGPKGASVGMGQYLNFGYWQVDVCGDLAAAVLSTGGDLNYIQVCVQGGYMYRVAKNYSRSVNLYAGGGIIQGCEVADPFGMAEGLQTQLTKSCSYLYGLYPKVELELFPFRGVALALHGSLPVIMGSQYDKVLYPKAGASLRFML